VETDLFVSYSRRDLPRILPLIDELRNRGLTVWIDVGSIEGATNWSEEIMRGLRSTKAVLVIASRSAFASEYVMREVMLAAEERRPFIPLFLEPVEIPPALRLHFAGIQRIDFAEPPAQLAEAIIRALRVHATLPRL
jgi:hypothetical protein